MSAPEPISILVCTHNRAALLDQTLATLAALERPDPNLPLEAIVVANGCTDDTHAVVGKHAAGFPFPLRVVDEPRLGLSHARNRAAREARYPILAYIDDDVLLAPRWLIAMTTAFATTPASAVGGPVELWLEIDRPSWLVPEFDTHLSRIDWGGTLRRLETPAVVGANFAVRRKLFDDAGPFDPALGRIGNRLLAGEETIFLQRAMDLGHQLWYAPEAHLRHFIPKKRIDLPYLLNVIGGKAESEVLMGKDLGFLKRCEYALRAMVAAPLHKRRYLRAKAAGDEPAAMRSLIRHTHYRHYFIAWRNKLLGRAPA